VRGRLANLQVMPMSTNKRKMPTRPPRMMATTGASRDEVCVLSMAFLDAVAVAAEFVALAETACLATMLARRTTCLTKPRGKSFCNAMLEVAMGWWWRRETDSVLGQSDYASE